MCQTIEILTVVDNDGEQTTAKIMLPMKCENFANIFNKQNANILFEHSMHDLAIEIEKGKQLLFGLVYNYLAIELQTFYEYINNMLAKDFIQPLKLLFNIFVLFTKKKDNKLRLYVNY